MRAANKFILDDDIIDRLLRSSYDFAMLQSFVLSCRAVHSVYDAHPKSIIRAVAYNIVGPVLPQALQLIKNRSSDDDPSSYVPPVDANTIISPDEMNALEHNEVIVRQLEDLFSIRHKDRNSHASMVSDVESQRFHRAMYNFWLFQSVHPCDADPAAFALNSFDAEAVRVARASRLEYLENYASQDLQEMNSVAQFLWEVHASTIYTEGVTLPTYSYDMALALGPEFILDSFQNYTYILLHYSDFFLGYISTPISNILTNRQVKPLPDPYLTLILDTINGADDQCSRCQDVAGLGLWTESNWDLLKIKINAWDMQKLLGPTLGRNMIDVPPVFNILRKEPASILMNEIHDLRVEPYLDWDKQDLLCLSCLKTLIQHHLKLWGAQRLRAAGHPEKEDCWYGYACRTQTHKVSHAQRRNHFCEPTRGDL